MGVCGDASWWVDGDDVVEVVQDSCMGSTQIGD